MRRGEELAGPCFCVFPCLSSVLFIARRSLELGREEDDDGDERRGSSKPRPGRAIRRHYSLSPSAYVLPVCSVCTCVVGGNCCSRSDGMLRLLLVLVPLACLQGRALCVWGGGWFWCQSERLSHSGVQPLMTNRTNSRAKNGPARVRYEPQHGQKGTFAPSIIREGARMTHQLPNPSLPHKVTQAEAWRVLRLGFIPRVGPRRRPIPWGVPSSPLREPNSSSSCP